MRSVLSAWIQLTKRNKGLFAWLTAVLAASFLLDFSLRVFVSRDDELRKFSSPKVHPLAKSEGVDAIRARFEAIFPAPPSQEEVAAAMPRDIALQGVFISKRSREAALVLMPQGDKPLERHILPVGGEIDGWTVQRIDHSSVTLGKGPESKELVMFRTRL